MQDATIPKASDVGPTKKTAPGLSAFAAVPRDVKWLIYLLSFSSVGNGFTMVMIAAYLPMIGVASGTIGLVLGVSGATFVISAIPLGIVSDRIGRKWMLLLGTMKLPPALLIFAFTTQVPLLVVAGFVMGIAQAMFLSTWNAMIADKTSIENREAAFSLSFVVSTLTSGVGSAVPVLFPVIMGATGFDSFSVHRYTMVLFAAVALLSPISLGWNLRDYKEKPREPRNLKISKSTRRMLRFSGINGLIGLGAGFIIPLIPTWLFLKFGIPDTYSGPLLSLSSATIGLAAIASPGLSRRYGPIRAIVLTQSFSMVFMVSVALVPWAALAAGLYIVRAALMNMSSPISDSYLMGIISPEERGLASAINTIVWRLPNSVTTVFGGLMLQGGEFVLPFLIATAFYMVSISLLYAFFRNVKPGSQVQNAETI